MFRGFFNILYFRIRKKEIRKSKYRLKRIKINTILEVIIRNCEEKGIKYNILEKNKSELVVELIGKEERILLKYDKADMIFHDEYYNFVAMLNKLDIKKGIYITCGLFEGNIHGNRIMFHKKIIFDDYAYFMKKQLGIFGKTIDVFRNKSLNFYKYLPR